jgi:hypothetical protein
MTPRDKGRFAMTRLARITAVAALAAVWAAAAPVAAQTPVGETPGLLTEPVVRVRLAKLGYTNVQRLTRNGDYWEAVVPKNGAMQTLRFHVLSNARLEGPVPLRRLPLGLPKPISSPG